MGLLFNKNIVYPHRRIFFEGNSLFNVKPLTINPLLVDYGGKYVVLGIYNNFTSGRQLVFNSYALEGQTGTQILSNAVITTFPYLKNGDIIFYWEGSNDMAVNALTGAQAWANVTAYLTLAQAAASNLTIVIGTVIARDFATDAADLMTRIGDYNTLVRNNTNLGYTVWDIGADSRFDARADASNAAIYTLDKVHQIQAGQDIVIASANTTLGSVI